jgi:hypothetical protein
MAAMQYCVSCKRNVTPKKDFNWIVFVFLCGLFYLPFYLMQKPKCPICNGEQFSQAQYTT